MSEEFGPNFITLTDEDGKQWEFELLDDPQAPNVTTVTKASAKIRPNFKPFFIKILQFLLCFAAPLRKH